MSNNFVQNKGKLTVIDTIGGYGKTKYAIQRIKNASKDEKFIYISSSNENVKRVKDSVKKRDFINYNVRKKYVNPYAIRKSIENGDDIVCTQPLFNVTHPELFDLIKERGYTLILDEAHDLIQQVDATRHDYHRLFSLGYINVPDGRYLEWNSDPRYDFPYYEGVYNHIKQGAERGSIFSKGLEFYSWSFLVDLLPAFNDVLILTYQFESQLQKYFFVDVFGYDYELKSLEKGEKGRLHLTEYDPQTEERRKLYDLMTIHTSEVNEEYVTINPFTSSRESKEKAQEELSDFFKKTAKAKATELIWTTENRRKETLEGRGYSGGFVDLNTRATDKYKDKRAVAYVQDPQPSEEYKIFFDENNVSVDEEKFAISELLQFVFRSRIRKGKKIDLYLPSKRMRDLLEKWANYEI